MNVLFRENLELPSRKADVDHATRLQVPAGPLSPFTYAMNARRLYKGRVRKAAEIIT
jgi:hypothetical protein